MKEEFISTKDLLAMYRASLDSFLLPLNLAVDFEKLDERYRAAIDAPRWTKRRTELKPEVDAIITSILSGSTASPTEQWLRRIPNETLVYYFDRLMIGLGALEELARDSETKIPCPASWCDFWIDFLVNKAWGSDQDNS